MNYLKDPRKVILTDCDGVLLDWGVSFESWMANQIVPHEVVDTSQYDIAKRYGLGKDYARSLVRSFNESAHIGFLTPHRDAIQYVRKLHENLGYVFVVITSLSSCKYAQDLRIMNLQALFGKNVFVDYIFLPCGARKIEVLSEFADTGCLWVEDKLENAQDGEDLGLYSMLMDSDHNQDKDHDIAVVENWREIYVSLV